MPLGSPGYRPVDNSWFNIRGIAGCWPAPRGSSMLLRKPVESSGRGGPSVLILLLVKSRCSWENSSNKRGSKPSALLFSTYCRNASKRVVNSHSSF